MIWLFIVVCSLLFILLVLSRFWSVWLFWATLVVGQGGQLFLVVYFSSLLFFCLFLVGFGRFGCFGRHLLLGRVGGVVTEVKGKQQATSLAAQPTSMWDHAFPRSMMILLMNLMI